MSRHTEEDLQRMLSNPEVRIRGEAKKPEPKPDTTPRDALSEPPEAATTSEATLQAEAEAWLTQKGYRRRVPKHIQTYHGGKWFLHFPKTKSNPIILDLILLDSNEGRYLEVELKVSGGRLSPDQRWLVTRGEGALCWNMEQLKAVVNQWENKGETE